LRERVGESVFLHAEALYRGGAVKIKSHNASYLQGTVYDSPTRYVMVRGHSKGRPYSECTCYSMEEICVHGVALLLGSLKQLDQGFNDQRKEEVSWQSYVQGLPQPPVIAPTPQTQTYRLMFFLSLKPSGWTLWPARTYIKKNGEIGQRSRFENSSYEFQNLRASSAEKQAVNYLAQLKGATNGYGSYYPYSNTSVYEFAYGAELGQVFEILSNCRVFLEDRSTQHFTPVRFVEPSAKLRFQLENAIADQAGAEQFDFFPQIQRNGHPEDLDESYHILSANPLWILKEDQLFRVHEAVPAAYLLPFTREKHRLKIPRPQAGDFLQMLVPRLTPQVDLVLPADFSLQTARTLTGRRLYLRERDQVLYLELRFVYGDVEVNGQIGQQVCMEQAGETGELWRVERDLAGENAVHETLAASGLNWEARSGAYFPKENALVWLFDELPKLAEAGFEIYGEEDLQRHRVNRASPSVRVKAAK
jgi:hypothetical protein